MEMERIVAERVQTESDLEKVAKEISEIDRKRDELTQAALRMEGAIRLLKKLEVEEGKKNGSA